MKIIAEWDDNVSLPDSKVNEWAKSVVKNGVELVKVGTATMVNALRLEVFRGNLKPVDLEFHFRGHVIKSDKDGRLDNWPDGFGDVWDKQLEELLGWKDLARQEQIKE